jgi:hypothetical protein
LHTILIEFYGFVLGRLVPMLAAWPVWSLRMRRQRRQVRQARVKRGNPRRNPTVLR